jgi:hypothetical protein
VACGSNRIVAEGWVSFRGTFVLSYCQTPDDLVLLAAGLILARLVRTVWLVADKMRAP